MMMVFSLLRHADKERVSVLDHSLSHYCSPSALQEHGYYFYLKFTNNEICLYTAMLGDDFIHCYLPILAHYPWVTLPNNYIKSLVAEKALKIEIESIGEFDIEFIKIDKHQEPTIHSLKTHYKEHDIHIIEIRENNVTIDRNLISITSKFQIGFSYTNKNVIDSLSTLDYLLIQETKNTVSLNDIPSLTYSWNREDNTMTLEENYEEDDISYDNVIEEEETIITDLVNTNSIPLKIDFVIYQKTFTLNELQQLTANDKIYLQPDSHKKIKCEINGQCVAKGELVQIGEQLAIEIHELFSNK